MTKPSDEIRRKMYELFTEAEDEEEFHFRLDILTLEAFKKGFNHATQLAYILDYIDVAQMTVIISELERLEADFKQSKEEHHDN